jgi:uncharacterized protein YigE (DUF2233 family)
MLRIFLSLMTLVLATAMARADGPCELLMFEDRPYTACRFDLREDALALYNLDADGRPYGSFSVLAADLSAQGKSLVFAMNAGMYDEALRPIGLYVENGHQLKKVNRRAGGGNFHLKPNGVFWIKGDRGGVTETEAYVKEGLGPDFATQSGPMLVIDGDLHPKFTADGTSAKQRNGVGAIDDHHVVFVISEGPVNFHSFARLFRDGLGCRNALFLDGSISSLFDAAASRNDDFVPLGPMVGLAR